VTASGANLNYQWYFNGAPLLGATTNRLERPNVEPGALGAYSVRVTNDLTGRYADSHQAILEISSNPSQGKIFQDKLERLAYASVPAGHVTRDDVPTQVGFLTVAAGVVGYQIGNNYRGLTDLREPNHGDLISHASLWLLLATTNAGTLVIDTRGSEIDNVFAVYRWDGLYVTPDNGLLGFATNAANGQIINSVLVTNTSVGSRFAVAAAGLQGQPGTLKVNWSLGTPPQPTNAPAPGLPAVRRLTPGGDLTLRLNDPGVTNAVPAPVYRWYRDDEFIGETLVPTLVVPGASLISSGTYRVVAINALGMTTNVLERILVNVPINIASGSAGYHDGVFELTLAGTEGDSIVLQATTNWLRWTDLAVVHLTGYGQTFADNNARLYERRFYRSVREGSFTHLASALAGVGEDLAPNRAFQFTLPPSVEVPVVVEASSNLHDWTPVLTNPLSPSATLFTDQAATNSPIRFYRLRLTK
jgi:hypothetical protein